jgi:hypothetical protein
MPRGPSPALERIIGAFIPPACREEVLGDLREKCASPRQYIGLAISVIPFVILSRIRRTSDLQIRLTEALLIYGSFLTAAWYSERTVLSTHQGIFLVAIPTVASLIDLVFEDLWAGGSKWPSLLVWSIAFGIGFALNVYGEFASMLLIRGLHLVIGRGANLPRQASGPPVPWNRRATQVAVQGAAKSLLVAAGAVTLAALLLELAGRPVGKSTIVSIAVLVVAGLLPKPPKEL